MEPLRMRATPGGGESSSFSEGRGQPESKKLLILVVEDDDPLRDALCDVLSGDGHRVVAATNGLHALAQLQTLERPDLIILDLMMPVMNGWDFHSHLKANPALRTVAVLLLSAYVQRGSHTGPQDVEGALQKPVSMVDLLGWVRRLAIRLNR
jgi:two-component system, chemotaxis family, chemotaxis protein CheY